MDLVVSNCLLCVDYARRVDKHSDSSVLLDRSGYRLFYLVISSDIRLYECNLVFAYLLSNAFALLRIHIYDYHSHPLRH